MSITLELTPEAERGLLRQAEAKGLSLTDYLQELVSLQAMASDPTKSPLSGQALVDAFAEIRGLLSDAEIDAMLERNASTGRPVEL